MKTTVRGALVLAVLSMLGELVRSPEWAQWTRTGNGGPTCLFNNH